MVRAKFRFVETTEQHYSGGPSLSKKLVFQPMYDTSIPEDRRFAKATPSGRLEMVVDNPAAVEFFKPGADYYLDFTPVEE